MLDVNDDVVAGNVAAGSRPLIPLLGPVLLAVRVPRIADEAAGREELMTGRRVVQWHLDRLDDAVQPAVGTPGISVVRVGRVQEWRRRCLRDPAGRPGPRRVRRHVRQQPRIGALPANSGHSVIVCAPQSVYTAATCSMVAKGSAGSSLIVRTRTPSQPVGSASKRAPAAFVAAQHPPGFPSCGPRPGAAGPGCRFRSGPRGSGRSAARHT